MASEDIFPETSEIYEEICGDNGEEGIINAEAERIETNLEKEMDIVEEVLETEETNDEKNATDNAKEKTEKSSTEHRLTQLPLSKIKQIMKLDPDFQLASLEAVFLVTKATELFIDSLAKESFIHTRQSKKKIIQKRDVDLAISSVDSLIFLEDSRFF